MKTEIKKRAPVARDLIAQKVAYISDLAVAADGDYVKVANTLPQNLTALDTAIKNIPAQVDYTVSCTESTPAGYAKTYTLTQNGSTVATINIPKDMVVSSGRVVTNPDGQEPGTYIELTLANATSDKIYINVGTLVDIYTGGSQAGDMVVVDVDNETHLITAALTDGTVTKAKLAQGVQASLDLADGAVQKSEVGITTGTGTATITVKDGVSATVLTDHQDISGKAEKSEMTIEAVTGDDTKKKITLKSGLSQVVLVDHQDISGKADVSDLTAHTGNTDIHVTTADKAAWNGAVTNLGTHTADTTVHITAAERTAWNAKYDKPSTGIARTDLAQDVQDSLGAADSALQASNLDNTTIEKDATAGVRVKAGSITEAHLSTSVNASLDKADSAYQKPTTGIAKTDLASDVQTSLGKADTALQASDIANKLDRPIDTSNGCIPVWTAEGQLRDSGKSPADFATAAQGAKADTAVQPRDLGNVAPTSADNSTIEVSGTTLQVKDGGIGTAKVADGAVTTAKLATLTSFKLVDTANDGAPYQGQVYQITIDHGVLTVTPVA